MEQWISQNIPDLADISKIAEGGQKWVFGATHAGDGEVVVKVIKPGINIERVQREILAVRQVQSRRVPRILEVGVAHGSAIVGDLIWLREQRIAGQSVRERLEHGALPKEEVLGLCRDVLEALTDVAQARIVHRDIKPENIIIADDGTFWLLDFGIARHLDLASLTATAALGAPCTVGYAPPEQYRNFKKDVDGRADLFALAVTVVECMSGVHPFIDGARDARDILRRVENEPIRVPAVDWDPQGQLGELLSCMAQRRVDCRPRSAAEAHEWMNEIYQSLLA